jgi:hypothetical protein
MDILLDKSTWDAVFINGVPTVTTSLTETVAQRLKVRLLTFASEWIFNTEIGIPYFETIFYGGANKAIIDAIFQEEIKSDEDVLEIVSFSSSIENVDQYNMTFKVRINDGTTTDAIELSAGL